MSVSKPDPVLVEIVEGYLASVEKEVETAIGRTSRSPMIRDAHDYRAGIHDRKLRKLTGRSYSALVHPVAGAHNQHRRNAPGAPELLEQAQAVELGQHQVEDDRVVVGRARVDKPLPAVRGGVHRVAGGRQPIGQSRAQPHRILNDEQPHGGLRSGAGRNEIPARRANAASSSGGGQGTPCFWKYASTSRSSGCVWPSRAGGRSGRRGWSGAT